MGKIIIQKETTINPISLIGKEAGICWGSNVDNYEKNYKRGLDCINSNHGRTLEFAQIYMVLDGYSARVMREFYTHISGSPSRLQSSTRYINYEKGFDYVIPPIIKSNQEANDIYNNVIKEVSIAMNKLEALGMPREDIAMLLPLGMETTVVVRTNLRNMVDMSRQRLCSRAFWEYRQLMRDFKNAIADYSDEWNYLVNDLNIFHSKCEDSKWCIEKKSCGKYPTIY